MGMCYQILVQEKKVTQRELFYKLLCDSSDYFSSQFQVNRTVQDVVALLRCNHYSPEIMASSRWAISGRLLLQTYFFTHPCSCELRLLKAIYNLWTVLFSSHGFLDQHGFARNRVWSIDSDPPPFPTSSSSKAFVNLVLNPSEDDLKIWPHSFEFRLRITLGPGGDLMLTSRIRNNNTDGKPFTFTFAYHTYFSVLKHSKSCIQTCEVRVEGLETLDYLDNLQNKERFTEQGDAITFESKVDKIYLSTPTKIAILDHEKKRTFVIRKDGLPDAGDRCHRDSILSLASIKFSQRFLISSNRVGAIQVWT